MSRVIEKVQESQIRKDLPAFGPGDTIRVHVKLRETEGGNEKERVQPFEGVVIKRRGHHSGASFTVRRVSFGIGVERIFPLNSPNIASIEVVQKGNVRRAKLYYLRGLRGKSARIKRAEREVAPQAAAKKPVA
jgi:large subunit ribosomal protein L19